VSETKVLQLNVHIGTLIRRLKTALRKLNMLMRSQYQLNIRFVASVCLSVVMQQQLSQRKDFHQIQFISNFPKFY